MFSYIHSFYALVATLILSNSILVAHAGHVRFHKHHLKAHQHLHPRIANAEQGHGVSSKANLLSRDTNSTNTTDVSQILSDTTAFAKWIDVWATSTNASNSASSIAQVQEEARTYGAKMQTWLQANTASTSSTVQRIQLYFTTLNQWMDNWVAQANSTDPVAAKNSLQADIQEYVSWMTTLIGNLNSSSATGTAILSAIPSAAPSAVESLPSHLATSSFADAQVSFPAAGATTTSFVTAFVTSTTTLVSTSIIQSSSPPASSGILSVVSSSASSSGGGQFVQLPSSSISDSQSSTVSTTLVTSATASLAATVAASSSVSPNAPGPSSGFNPKASDNVAVYFGQTAATGQVPLPQLCSDASINIVLLAFLNDYFSTSPTNFGPFTAEVLAPQVTACQQQGKIVLLSLGGAKEYSESTFTDDTEATAFAHTLWNGFGGGTAGGGSRPFGSVKFDGFDVDNESGNQVGYEAFFSTLQSLYETDSSKKYYLSAAPQCPTPDQSIPLPSMQNMDFVWVQFFNNGNCNVGNSGFIPSAQTWSQYLKGGSGEGPMFMVGAPASSASAGSGYLESADMQKALSGVKSAGLSNFGGVMLWDGSQAIANGNYQQMVKQAL